MNSEDADFSPLNWCLARASLPVSIRRLKENSRYGMKTGVLDTKCEISYVTFNWWRDVFWKDSLDAVIAVKTTP